MTKISKILLPVDFSQIGAAAARQAAVLARHFGAELTLFHANPVNVPGAGAQLSGTVDTGWIAALEAQLHKDLCQYCRTEFADVTVKRTVVSGDPARTIVGFAHKEGVDLIVIPTHGYGGFRRSLLGSVTAKVLHDAHCPVWTGAHLDSVGDGRGGEAARDHAWHGIEKVVCAVDDSAQNEQVLGAARDLAREFQAQLAVVHAVPKIEPPDGFLDEQTRRARIAAAAAVIERALAKAGVEVKAIVREGEPAAVVSHVATEQGASVVVIGRTPVHGESGRLRSHAYAIIRDSPCPVISV